jgi:N6-adenosine-specific RNA methylase IME4
MSMDQILGMGPEILPLINDDYVLCLWCLNTMLPQALQVIHAWGFEFKTVGFVWAKQSKSGSRWYFGMGYHSRQGVELCLTATPGRSKILSHGVRQLIVSPVRVHSQKPDEIYERIEALYEGPFVEFFNRRTRPGWATA